MIKEPTINELADSMELALASPPSQAGLKLKSYRELASSLNTNISTIRGAMQRLVRKGILEQRPRSGTYIRRLPSNAIDSIIGIDPLPPEFLFKHFGRDDKKKSQSDLASTHYRFSMLGDMSFTSAANQAIYGAVSSQLNQRGHALAIQSIQRAEKQPLSVEELKYQITNHPYDGYIVLAYRRGIFQQATDFKPMPVVFFGSGHFLGCEEPFVFFSTADCVLHSILQLTDHGFTKIGFVGLSSKGIGYLRLEEKMYHIGMERQRLEYRNSILVDANVLDVMAIMNTIREALSRPDRPEALYVSDDTLLPSVSAVCTELGLQPGRDIGIITISNRGIPLCPGPQWSTYEFNAEEMARVIVDILEDQLVRGETSPMSVSIQPHWRPGATHTRDN